VITPHYCYFRDPIQGAQSNEDHTEQLYTSTKYQLDAQIIIY